MERTADGRISGNREERDRGREEYVVTGREGTE